MSPFPEMAPVILPLNSVQFVIQDPAQTPFLQDTFSYDFEWMTIAAPQLCSTGNILAEIAKGS